MVSSSSLDNSFNENSIAISLGNTEVDPATIPNVVNAVLARMKPEYERLMQQAKECPETVSDMKKSLRSYIKDRPLTLEEQNDLHEACKITPNWHVVTQEQIEPFRGRISVYKESQEEFNADHPSIESQRLYTTLRIDVKDIGEADSLDRILLHLRNKLLIHGMGDTGCFDVRLEKGVIPLESNPWKWHVDGEGFKRSITVCFSNIANWSTHIKISSADTVAEHGNFYDAHRVVHRAPIPSDLEEHPSSADYRLFIRYIDYHPSTARSTQSQNRAGRPKTSKFKPLKTIFPNPDVKHSKDPQFPILPGNFFETNQPAFVLNQLSLPPSELSLQKIETLAKLSLPTFEFSLSKIEFTEGLLVSLIEELKKN